MEERLQKIIARAGIASRRHAEELITSGLVTVNGQVVTKLGTKADAERDHIKVSGKLLQPDTGERVYLVLHKPSEVVATMNDPEGRESLRTFLHGVPERVYPVGRLEYHASGLVLLTNDGNFANTILQSHGLPQTYQMKLKSLLTFAEIETLQRETGSKIFRQRGKESPWYEVTLSEARQDALRSRLFQTGHPVEKIRRVRIGDLDIHGLAPGQFRKISEAEARGLLRAASRPDAIHAAPQGPPRELQSEVQRDTSREAFHATPLVAEHEMRRESPRAGGGEKRERAPFRPQKRWKKPGSRESRGGVPRREGGAQRFGGSRSEGRPSRHGEQGREDKARGQGSPCRFGGSERGGGPGRESSAHRGAGPKGFGGPRNEGRPTRHGGQAREDNARREGGPRRFGSSRNEGGPTRQGGQGRGDNARREGGPRRFGGPRNEGRPIRHGGQVREDGARGQGGPRREGGSTRQGGQGGKNRAGGQGRPHRGGGPRHERGPRRGRK